MQVFGDDGTFQGREDDAGRTNQARAKSIVSIRSRHAKNFVEVLGTSMADYEGKFGKIETPKEKQPVENVTMRGYS